jgi:hypothetical protein
MSWATSIIFVAIHNSGTIVCSYLVHLRRVTPIRSALDRRNVTASLVLSLRADSTSEQCPVSVPFPEHNRRYTSKLFGVDPSTLFGVLRFGGASASGWPTRTKPLGGGR